MIGPLLLDHLNRLAGWAIGSLLVGLVLILRPEPALKAAGGMTMVWAAINLAIALGTRGGTEKSALASTREFLALNLGLNCAYIAVGICLLIMGKEAARGSGIAVAIQGLGLLVLDGYLYAILPKVNG